MLLIGFLKTYPSGSRPACLLLRFSTGAPVLAAEGEVVVEPDAAPGDDVHVELARIVEHRSFEERIGMRASHWHP
ncbi:hypothetical protein [Paracidovorax avenae]|uniref:hypothetical protein n=1 Tax=Paracidovorax avenae TaxID=80867 RepID=UPI001650D716|nr:hypothetical protein [Paracidovorax avenae]